MNDLFPILLFTIANSLTPGPNNFMLMNSGLNFGIKKSVPHYLGVCLGFPLMALLVALGFGSIFNQFVWIKFALKIVGSLYILYLAWQILIASNNSNASSNHNPFGFLQAIFFQWVNPKAWLMAIGAISIFTLTTNYFHNALAISVIFLLGCCVCSGIWMLFGACLQRILTQAKHRRWFNIIMAGGLVASIGMIVFD